MQIAGILTNLIHEAEELMHLNTGADKKAFVLDQIAKLDDKTVLGFIPNELEEQFLSFLVDYTVSIVKKK